MKISPFHSLFLIGLCSLLPVLSAIAQEMPPRAELGNAQVSVHTIDVDGLNANETVDAIRHAFRGTPLETVIHLEWEEVDAAKVKGIRVSERLAALREKQAKGKLSTREADQLRSLASLSSSPESIIGWDVPQAAGVILASTPKAALTQFCARFPNFTFADGPGGSIIVHPKESVLNFKLGPLSVKEAILGEVMGMAILQKPLGEHGIGYMEAHVGSGPFVSSALFSSLELPELPAREFLARLAQALGPKVSWELAGFRESRFLGFGGSLDGVKVKAPPH